VDALHDGLKRSARRPTQATLTTGSHAAVHSLEISRRSAASSFEQWMAALLVLAGGCCGLAGIAEFLEGGRAAADLRSIADRRGKTAPSLSTPSP